MAGVAARAVVRKAVSVPAHAVANPVTLRVAPAMIVVHAATQSANHVKAASIPLHHAMSNATTAGMMVTVVLSGRAAVKTVVATSVVARR